MPRAYDPMAGNRAIFDALIAARDAHGAKKPVLEDQERNPLTYTDPTGHTVDSPLGRSAVSTPAIIAENNSNATAYKAAVKAAAVKAAKQVAAEKAVLRGGALRETCNDPADAPNGVVIAAGTVIVG